MFFIAERQKAQKWIDAGAVFHPFPTPRSLLGELGENEQVYRLVASFISTTEDVENLERVLNT